MRVRQGLHEAPVPLDYRAAIGKQYRAWSVGKHVSGEMNAVFMCSMAYFHTESGGVGLEDFSIKIECVEKHASEHCKMILAREFSRPDLFNLKAPLYCKKDAHREMIDIPMRVAHATLDSAHDHHEDSDVIDMPSQFWHNAYINHPVVRRELSKGTHWTRILPIALYWDGVKYTTRDSFVGFYFRDLRTGKQYLAMLVRLSPRFSLDSFECVCAFCDSFRGFVYECTCSHIL